jgi:hypothetical protein
MLGLKLFQQVCQLLPYFAVPVGSTMKRLQGWRKEKELTPLFASCSAKVTSQHIFSPRELWVFF